MDVKCGFGEEFGGFEAEEIGACEGGGGVFCVFGCHGVGVILRPLRSSFAILWNEHKKWCVMDLLARDMMGGREERARHFL